MQQTWLEQIEEQMIKKLRSLEDEFFMNLFAARDEMIKDGTKEPTSIKTHQITIIVEAAIPIQSNITVVPFY